MARHFTLACLSVLSCLATAAELPFAVPDAAQGERRYKAVLAKIPEYGACWSDAVARLERGCDELNEELQGRLALAFTSCFLTKMGLEPLYCPESEPLSSHTRSRQWQAEAARTISELGTSSMRATAELQRAAKVQEKLSQQQLLMQERGEHLEQKLASAYSMLQEHRHLLDTGLSRLSNVQMFFADQFATLHSVAYYSMAAVLSLLMTTSKRTAAARPWLLLLFLANLGAERLLVKWASDDAWDSAAPLAEDSPLGVRIALCRRAVCLVALAVFLYKLYTFRDLAAMNNELLVSLQTELRTLHNLHSGLSSHGSPSWPAPSPTTWRSQQESPGYWYTMRGRASLFGLYADSGSSVSSTDDLWYASDYDDQDSEESDSGVDEAASSHPSMEAEGTTKPSSRVEVKAETSSPTCGSLHSTPPGTGIQAAVALVPPISPPPAHSWANSPVSPSSRYNLRPRRSLNLSGDFASPNESLRQRHQLTVPQPVIERGTVLSSDED
ncbi:hypothetical protein V5799_008467 [Amblyomma americanum]|uniref:Uncharacterized protein n=1 Tax=Amblyomma americanum TaxID=6943 RepID=A0AAQ4FDC5_AMBAM